MRTIARWLLVSQVLLLPALVPLSSSDRVIRSRNRHDRHSDTYSQSSSLLSRHRRVPEPKPLTSAETESNAIDQGANNYKPEILNCNTTEARVFEESAIGTEVIQVRAIDRDSESLEHPNSGAGKIVFSIVSTHEKFKINSVTGQITTNKIFNRDEPEREKEVHVTVKARDKGRPVLEDVCTIKVQIMDINDNAPIFDRSKYDIPIARDTLPGTTVMRVSATDVDEGVNQNITYELTDTNFAGDIDYFRLDEHTGVVTLAKELDKPENAVFVLKAIARDGGTPARKSETIVTINVEESNNKPPKFRMGPGATIELSEGNTDWTTPIASYTAESNIPGDPELFFELVNGRTEQTNKDTTFRHQQDENNQQRVNIYLNKALEFEKVQSYTLTLQVRNNKDLVAEAQLDIKVKDTNNKSPVFTNIESGAVLEHEPPGTVVMSVSAIDGDGTYPNNRVKYSISDSKNELKEKFEINEDTGVITTKVEFDREETPYYALTIIASDGATSSLRRNNKPNQTSQKFRIVIKDKNDNPPFFKKQSDRVEVPEDANIGSKVTEVKAEDLDKEASIITYSITSGNLELAFNIEPETGIIRVNNELDYEKIREYELSVQAWDGQFSNSTTVKIDIININDMAPKFKEEKYTTTLKENFVPSYPIFKVQATDPDIEDPSVPQNITYFLDETNQIAPHFRITNDGALRIVKALDRDPPNGYPKWSMFVFAKDENGSPSGKESFVQFEIELEDVNDNAPFLDMPEGLQWPENSSPGVVGELLANDYDTPANGPPFTFKIDPKAPLSVKNKFGIEREGAGYYLTTREVFDREEQKQYEIPIEIADNQGVKAVSYLKLVIGDKNDNPMAPGSSEIFVYNYRGRAPTTEIGRVYVNDPDDWDLPDKTFRFQDPSMFPDFSLDIGTGMISMQEGIKLEEDVKVYHMEFLVEDKVHRQTGPTAVPANVTVTVQKIPEVAVKQSGSIRLAIPPEKFVNLREKMTKLLRGYLHPNGSIVDVFTVLPANEGAATDVRWSAHGSPYHAPERMEVTVARRKEDIQRQLGADILMIHVDECLFEKDNKCEGSCYNALEIENQPTAIMTNTTTFVGVTAKIEARCGCKSPPLYPTCRADGFGDPADVLSCLNDGVCDGTGRKCKCPADNTEIFGPRCEKLAASFRDGWTTHKGISSCANTTVSFKFTTKRSDGLLLYQGPSLNTVVEGVTDFMALEISNGQLKYFINFGADTQTGVINKHVNDGEEHHVSFSWTNSSVKVVLDNGECIPNLRDCQVQAGRPKGGFGFLNSNGPLQVGGLYFGRQRLHELASKLGVRREYLPAGRSYGGCIRDMRISEGGATRHVSLGTPADGEKYQDGCNMEYVLAREATGMNLNFLIIILVVLAVILITVIVLTMYRRRRVHYSDKDIDCDIRENIINYEDEGGGEGDQTGYDLSVLRMMAHENGGPMLANDKMRPPMPPAETLSPPRGDIPGVEDFLDETKDRMDQDPDSSPLDDLRHYAYEGDENSGGSLSSLNSGTEDGDLEFEYLHNFGPRFKKLAEMYGRESDSDDSQEGMDNLGYYPSSQGGAPAPPPGSESWC